MEHDAMLARLARQADDEGVDLVMVRALVEEASAAGAARAMERLGLADAGARADVAELRDLLKAWRDAKKAARAAVIGWIVRGCLAMLLVGLAAKMGLFDLVRA